MEEKACFRVYVEGRVQGVFFRANTKAMAEKLGVKGWVRNLPDGRVEIVAEGPYEAVGALVGWALRGPRHARVERLVAERVECVGYDGFVIRY